MVPAMDGCVKYISPIAGSGAPSERQRKPPKTRSSFNGSGTTRSQAAESKADMCQWRVKVYCPECKDWMPFSDDKRCPVGHDVEPTLAKLRERMNASTSNQGSR